MNEHTQNIMFSSHNHRWETRPEFIDPIKKVFPFDLDVCASRPNICARYFTEEGNSLQRAWKGLCWMNPPYGREGPKWLRRAARQTKKHGSSLLALIPAKAGTHWFQDVAAKATQITIIRGRVKFGSDEYWKWLWSQPKVDRGGRMVKNPLYRKYGRIDAAPFDSAFMMFGEFTQEQFDFIAAYGLTFRPGDLKMSLSSQV